MPIDKEELSKLPPQERIKKLKAMEEASKKEFDEIESLIKKSMQELKIDNIAKDIAPEQRTVDISGLFEAGNGQNLERTARQGSRRTAQAKGTSGYQTIAQTYQAYSQLKELYGIVSGGGSLTEGQKAAIGQIGERLNIAERYMTESEKTASKLDASRNVLYKLRKETGLN